MNQLCNDCYLKGMQFSISSRFVHNPHHHPPMQGNGDDVVLDLQFLNVVVNGGRRGSLPPLPISPYYCCIITHRFLLIYTLRVSSIYAFLINVKGFSSPPFFAPRILSPTLPSAPSEIHGILSPLTGGEDEQQKLIAIKK